MAEIHIETPVLPRVGSDTHWQLMQGIRQAKLSSHEFHEAIPAHSQHGIGSGVFDGWQGFPIANLAGLVTLSRRRQLERFMRAFMVVDNAPVIKGGLSSVQIGEAAPRQHLGF